MQKPLFNMVNRVFLIGNLGRDPEVRTLESGAMVAKFSIATNENYRDKNGEWQTLTEWHEIVAWRERAEQAQKLFKKGSLVYIEGKLTHRKYQDQEGNDRYRTEVVANYMRLLKSRDEGGSSYFPSAEDDPQQAVREESSSKDTAPVPETDTDADAGDDLPF